MNYRKSKEGLSEYEKLLDIYDNLKNKNEVTWKPSLVKKLVKDQHTPPNNLTPGQPDSKSHRP